MNLYKTIECKGVDSIGHQDAIALLAGIDVLMAADKEETMTANENVRVDLRSHYPDGKDICVSCVTQMVDSENRKRSWQAPNPSSV